MRVWIILFCTIFTLQGVKAEEYLANCKKQFVFFAFGHCVNQLVELNQAYAFCTNYKFSKDPIDNVTLEHCKVISEKVERIVDEMKATQKADELKIFEEQTNKLLEERR
jgi:hypothetical protein